MSASAAKKWSKTLRLPKSSFPPRPSLAEQAIYLKRCTDDLYKWQTENRRSQKPFVLHDGPPYANGPLHIGHALNKILKDMICRSELHQGRRVQYVPGWDCHGLPIEIKALEQHRAKNSESSSKLGAVEIRRAARALATKTVKAQKNGFREWAIMGEWDNAWTTMDKTFEVKQLGVFLEMVKKGLIFRRYKPVYWSPSSGTALAEAELEYNNEHESTAAYVMFPLDSIPDALQQKGIGAASLSAVVWTTTPWTLPANRAIAIGLDLQYTAIKSGENVLIIAKSRLAHVAEQCGFADSHEVVVDTILGSELVGSTYKNALRGQLGTPQPVIAADFVSADSGTGLVHCAPGHGMDDYEVCTSQGIPAFAPVDDAGNFTAEALPDQPEILKGVSVLNGGSAKILELLSDQVLGIHKYKHKYPYDWRTKLPVIVRATEQWFADVGSIKERTLKSLLDVKFIPESGRQRLESFVRGRSEWCISRQRAWGVPIPALYDANGKAVLTEASVAHIIANIEQRGIDSWWTDAEDDPTWIAPGIEGSYTRGKDTMDVWFDSGSSWTQTTVQADVYSEGTDQHRGWFQSSLLTHASASGRDCTPYKTCITHGFTLDKDGRKMSKSIGNTIAPDEIIRGTLLAPVKMKGKGGGLHHDALGADALRLWAASSDYTKDVVIGEPVLKAIHTSLIKYRTTLKMLLGSIHPTSGDTPVTKLDQIALYQLDTAMSRVADAWKNYEFHKAISVINHWINVDLSSFYLEAMKDRVYCGDGGGVLYHIYQGLCQMLAPITPIMIEEAYQHRPVWLKQQADAVYPLHQSIQDIRAQFPKVAAEIAEDLPWLLNANAAIKTAQEEARAAKLIGSSLQSSVVLLLPAEAMSVFCRYEEELDAIFVVSSVGLNTAVDGEWQYLADFDTPGGKGHAVVLPPKDAKCPRCWRYVAPIEDELCNRCIDVVGQSSDAAANP